MKSKVMSLDEPCPPRSTYSSARNNAYRPNSNSAGVAASHQGRISPWLPVALGAVTVLIILRAISEEDKRTATERWLASANRRASKWWPEIRDTAESYGSRASRALPDYDHARDWLHDMMPTRRGISHLFSRGSDWLPNANVGKRQLLANFDWSNPPRWMRNIDLSTQSKRRRFLRDLRRYGMHKRDDLLSSIGWR